MTSKLLLFCCLFVVCLIKTSEQQRNKNVDIQGLSYSDADANFFGVAPTRPTTTTTIAPETTTKKGFFSGIKSFFKKSDKKEPEPVSTTTTARPTPKGSVQQTTTSPTVPVTTKKSVEIVSTTPVVPPRSPQDKSPPVPPRSPGSPGSNVQDPFPALSPKGSTPQTPSRSNVQDPFPPLSPKGSTPTPAVPVRPGSAQDPFPPLSPKGSTPQTPTRSGASDPFPPLPSRGSVSPTPAVPKRPQSPTQDNFPALPSVSVTQPTPTPSRAAITPSTPKNPWTGTVPAGLKPAPGGTGGVSFVPHGRPQDGSTTTTKKPPYAAGDTSSDAELMTLSETLFNRDINNPFKYVTVNYQGRTYSSATTDEALHPLLTLDDKIYNTNTVEKMKALFNNYELDTLTNEYVTPLERKEENELLDAVLATPVMRHAMLFLQQKNKVTADPATHRELLKTIWFNLYSRGQGKIGSSGFEHVFLAELKNSTVQGLHNWIYFAEEEKTGNLDYKGYSKKIDFGNKGGLVKLRFSFRNIDKPTNSLFIGTSPELEMALYTVCFEVRPDADCPLAYGGNRFNIVTHTFRYRGKNLIGSAYPEIV